jgi:tRNA-Thr(GGU) m(6)t(6)A37 methyltransferase TsaA
MIEGSSMSRVSNPWLVVAGLGLAISAVLTIIDVILESAKSKLRQEFESELRREREMREKERMGRINVQKRAREYLQKRSRSSGYSFKVIGTFRGPFPDRRGTPRQPILVPAAKGVIVFDKNLIQLEHFKELQEFSHIWVVFVFHENTNVDSATVPAKIKPPRLGGRKVGCLSTRSPHRPNPIGLSVCEVVDIGPDFIRVAGIDLVDGTPILDVKPYIPYDIIDGAAVNLNIEHKIPLGGGDSEIDPTSSTPRNSAASVAAARAPLPMGVYASESISISGCESELVMKPKPRALQVPSWIVDADIPMRPVSFEDAALEALEELARDGDLVHCASAEEAKALIFQVLRQDIRGVHQGRGKVSSSSSRAMENADETILPTQENKSKSKVSKGSSSINNTSGDIGRSQDSAAVAADSEYMCRLDAMEIRFVTTESLIRVTSISKAAPVKASTQVPAESCEDQELLEFGDDETP